MGLGLVFSMSRMGIVSMLISLGVMTALVYKAQSGKGAAVIGLIIIVAILGLAVYGGVDAILVRFEKVVHERLSDNDRIAMWRDAWKMIESKHFLGQGLGTFRWTYPAYERVQADTPARYAHNDYLQSLAEVGIVGLGLALWVFAAAWRTAAGNLWRSHDSLVRGIGLATLGCLTVIALQEITDFSLYIPGVALLVALLLGLNLRASTLWMDQHPKDRPSLNY